ncbi:phage holin family protein [Hoyosella sp. YIM 151337]|uniref:phage holin family protein n=1 Tax=Hoyosella sp. YIM 151337 TaxID=2992742 RepID=UPI0022362D10|nr:phage holin family protein [Hoyosella sp. YIM 151337]MCW4352820.1 phage holin family protein [Hoyosella sp. YIM 151337]
MLFIASLVINSFAIWLAAEWITGISLRLPGDSVGADALVIVLIGLVFTLVNLIVKPVVKLLSLPLVIITLGLFLLVINALMLLLTEWLTSYFDYGIDIAGFWAAFWGGLLIAIVNFVLGMIVPGKR